MSVHSETRRGHDGASRVAENPLSAYRRVLVERWPWVALLMFVTLGLASGYLLVQSESYDSTSTVFISTPRDDFDTFYRGNLYALERAPSYAALLQSPDLAERVKKRANLSESTDELIANTKAVIVPSTVLIQLTTSADSPELARSINQAFIDEFVDEVASLEAVPGAITPRAQLLVVEKPTLSLKPGGFPPSLLLGAAAAIGLAGGALLAVLLTLADKRIRRPEDAEESIDGPLLAVFNSPSTRDRTLEAARTLRDSLTASAETSTSHVVMIASAEPKAGRSTTARLLSEVLRDRGQSVALIDLDLRKATTGSPRATDAATPVTASDVILGSSDPDDALGNVHDGITEIPAGDPREDAARASDSPRIPLLIERARATHSWVVIDTPAGAEYSDALRLAPHVDTTVLVARYGKTRFDRLRACADDLRASGHPIAGAVLIALPGRRTVRHDAAHLT